MAEPLHFLDRMFAEWLYDYGHESTAWGAKDDPPAKGHLVAVRHPIYISAPCWKELVDAADTLEVQTVCFPDLVAWASAEDIDDVYLFYFSDFTKARVMAERVQSSARNKRKDLMRRIRKDEAGGFHNQWAIERLLEIQEGLCYYTGERLTTEPKNYVKDHIKSLWNGGTDWPGNIALVTQEINRLKGGVKSSNAMLKWLAQTRGDTWYRQQVAFCRKVDRLRKQLDKEFRQRYSDNGSLSTPISDE